MGHHAGDDEALRVMFLQDAEQLCFPEGVRKVFHYHGLTLDGPGSNVISGLIINSVSGGSLVKNGTGAIA